MTALEKDVLTAIKNKMKIKVERYNYVAIWCPQAWPTPTTTTATSITTDGIFTRKRRQHVHEKRQSIGT